MMSEETVASVIDDYLTSKDVEIARLRRALEAVDRYVMPPSAKAIITAALNTQR